MDKWTKEDYQHWLITRDADPAQWSRADCISADKLIRDEALKNLREKTKNLPKALSDYIFICADAHFGSVETDGMLMELDCYPDWMEPRR